MDEEQQGQTLDAESMDFGALQEAMRGGRFDRAEDGGDATGERSGEASPLQAALAEVDGDTPAATDESAPQDRQPEAAATTEERQDPPPAEDWQRKYHSTAGNNRQLQQQVAQLRQEREQFARELAQIRAQQEEVAELAKIRAAVPPELQDEAIAEWQKQRGFQRTEQEMEQYRQFLQAERQRIAQANLNIFRQALPQDMPQFAEFVAERAGAPAEPLKELLDTEAMRQLYPLVESQRDLDLVAQVLFAVAEREAVQDRARKETNRQAAVAENVHRDVAAARGGGGLAPAQRIDQMTDAQFLKFQERLRAQGSMRGLT